MNKEIYELLKKCDLLDEEIKNCFEICPGLDIVDYSKARNCVIALIERGYPSDDVGLLLAVNPAILLYNPKTLATKLADINGNIEEVLKNDPFII